MELKIKKTKIPVFGWTVDDDSEFYLELIEQVKKGASIVHTFPRIMDTSKEYLYMFYKSIQPTIIETSFEGKIEFVGIYPEQESQFTYQFTPYGGEVLLENLTISDLNDGNDMAIVEEPETFRSANTIS